MAAGDTTTKNGIAASAFQYDQTSNPVKTPTAMVADGYDGKFGLSEGHKIAVNSGASGTRFAFPKSGDGLVTVSGHTFVLDNTAFTALFNTPA